MNRIKNVFKSMKLVSVWVGVLCVSVWNVQAQNNAFQWVKQIGSNAQETGWGVATDSKGNVYATGTFRNTAFIGPLNNGDSITSIGNTDIFLTKMDNNGQLLWVHAIGADQSDEGHAVTVDNNDNVIITGSYRNTVDFDKGTSTAIHESVNGSVDVFIAKYDSAGNHVWSKTFGGKGLDRGYSVTTDKWNNVYVTGRFVDTISIPELNTLLIAPVAPNAFLATADIFVCKLNAAGNFIWAKNIGHTGSDEGHTITIDNEGNPIITGEFVDSVDFNPGSGNFIMHSTNGAQFITKWDSAANFIWAKKLDFIDNYKYGYLIAADTNNNIFLTGSFSGKVDFNLSPQASDTFYLVSDSNTNSTGYSTDGFLLKLDKDGNFDWVKQIAGSGIAVGEGLTLDPIGNAYVVGQFTRDVKFDSSSINNQFTALGNGGDIFISKYSNTGQNIWNVKYGGISGEVSRAIATDNSANVFTAGHFVTTGTNISNFHTGTDTVALSSRGGYDAFVHKIGCINSSFAQVADTSCSDYYTIGDYVFTESGQYTVRFWGQEGCDSIIQLDLVISHIEKPYITVSESVLSVTNTYAKYQWLKDGNVIANANDATFTVKENGSYSVAVLNKEGCSDTSDAYVVNNATSVQGLSLQDLVSVYPNPAKAQLFIESPVAVQYYITGIEGKKYTGIRAFNTAIDIAGLPSGIYLLHVLDINGVGIKVEKIVKQ